MSKDLNKTREHLYNLYADKKSHGMFDISYANRRFKEYVETANDEFSDSEILNRELRLFIVSRHDEITCVKQNNSTEYYVSFREKFPFMTEPKFIFGIDETKNIYYDVRIKNA